MTLLPHLAARLFGVPLLLARPKLDLILAVLGSRLGLEPPAHWPEVGSAPTALVLPGAASSAPAGHRRAADPRHAGAAHRRARS